MERNYVTVTLCIELKVSIINSARVAYGEGFV